MRIGFLGNTNNYPFRLAQSLRQLGHEVVVFVDRPRNEIRHRPECHYNDIQYPYPDWVQEIEPLTPSQIVLRPWTLKGVLRVLDVCDGVVLNGLALSLGTRIRRPLIGLLTGSDLDVFANPGLLDVIIEASSRLDRYANNKLLKRILLFCKRILYMRFMRVQRAGIARCSLVEYAVQGLLPQGDTLLEEIGVQKANRVSFMITDIDDLPTHCPRTDGTFQIFCAARLQWKRTVGGVNISPLDLKGTDLMLQGLKLFVSHVGQPVEIRMIAFGADVIEAKRYVEELGLAALVYWLPQLTQAEFLNEMARANVVLENFGDDSCIGMAGRDAMAMGIPVVASAKSEIFERELGESLPIFEARKPDEICARLNEIIRDPVVIARHSMRARLFAARWFSARRAAEHCLEVLKEKQKGRKER